MFPRAFAQAHAVEQRHHRAARFAQRRGGEGSICRCGEMADARDLKSRDLKKSCRFESDHRHQSLRYSVSVVASDSRGVSVSTDFRALRGPRRRPPPPAAFTDSETVPPVPGSPRIPPVPLSPAVVAPRQRALILVDRLVQQHRHPSSGGRNPIWKPAHQFFRSQMAPIHADEEPEKI